MDHLTVACWFWEKGCHLDIDWAAWVQAIGSVMAIAYASKIASTSRREAVSANNKLVRLFIQDVLQDFQFLVDSCAQKNIYGFNLNIKKLATNEDILNIIKLELLPYEAIYGLMTLKGIIFHAIEVGEIDDDVDFDLLDELCGSFKKKAEEHANRVIAHLN